METFTILFLIHSLFSFSKVKKGKEVDLKGNIFDHHVTFIPCVSYDFNLNLFKLYFYSKYLLYFDVPIIFNFIICRYFHDSESFYVVSLIT